MLEHFPTFARAVQKRYDAMATTELFTVDVADIYASYLAAFPTGTDPIFRERTEHDCNCCKHFIRRLGIVVTINAAGKVGTVWDDAEALPYPYNVVAERMQNIVRQAPISGVFRSKERQYGTDHNFDTASGRRWDHFAGRVGNAHFSTTPDEARGAVATAVATMRRGLDEIRDEDIGTVLDLIDSGSLYRGEEKRTALNSFRALQKAYLATPNRELFLWANAAGEQGRWLARFRNDVLGTLLVDLANGVDLDRAVRSYESKVAPTNYRRTTAVITPRMVDAAVAELAALGLEQAVERRFARIEDVSVNNVLFVDNSVKGRMRGGLTGLLMEAVRPAAVEVKNPTLVPIDLFLREVLPQLDSLDLLLENRHLSNFVSLTAPVHGSTGRLFKWDNDFAWSYDGEVTDSVKERVKAAGGKTGPGVVLRVSLAWSNSDDLDIHAMTPDRGHIYFGSKQGVLDVDMNALGRHNPTDPIENLSWTGSLADGMYHIKVKNYQRRMTDRVGFMVEVDTGGKVEQFTHAAGLSTDQTVDALVITVKGGVVTSITPGSGLVGGSQPTAKWGVTTGQLVPVDTLMLSPNHWDGQGVGNRHHLFFLKNCRNPDAARGIYTEFLRSDLEKHRKVFEVLGAKTKCQPTEEQLSGLGFSAGRGDSVVVVAKGKRVNQALEVRF